MFRLRVNFLVALVLGALVLSGCSSVSMTADELSRALSGSNATFRTYDSVGGVMDEVTGTSIRVSRDETFDELNSENTGKKSSVLLVQVGSQEIRHVGSTATLIEEGIDVIIPSQQGQSIKSTEDATPFIQKIIAKNENLWKGSAKTVLVRTQNDAPAALFSGKNVELYKPDIPNATALRVVGTDGKARYALIYRANLTIYDTALIAPGGR